MPGWLLRSLSWKGNGKRSKPGVNTGRMPVAARKKGGDRSVHQLLYFLFILFFFFEVEHGAEDPVPNGAAYAKALMFVLVMVQVMVAPKGFHPFKGRVPGVDGIVHAAIEQVAQYKPRKEHKDVGSHRKPHQKEQRRGNDQAGDRGHEQSLFVAW